MAGQWSPDSINVSGYMAGTNAGNDKTAYVNTFPLAIRIVIVAGELLAKQGLETRVPYDRIGELIR